MKKIITAAQTRDTDHHTIETEPIASIDLMERASLAFIKIFMELVPDHNTPILVCCGTGNNGGDGLAIARLLQERCYDAIAVWVARFSDRESDDFATNLARLHNTPISITEFFPGDQLPDIRQTVIIDALLGSGLNKPLGGDWLRLVQHLQQAGKQVIAVDIPTGLQADGSIPESEHILHADDVISFQRPKLSFFFPESSRAIDQFHIVDIGLDESFIEGLPSDFHLIEANDIQRCYRRRKPFSHKGNYGHALVLAGNTHTMGAALLCCGASLYSGTGLTTACIPPEGLTALNARYPEVMYCTWEDVFGKLETFDAIAIGPGLGTAIDMTPVLKACKNSLVVDADGLTFLGQHPALLESLPAHTILTPHMKEFDRLFGRHTTWWDRIQTAKEQALSHQIIIVLKNRFTFIVLPDGRVLINPTGNPAMASGGMGDVLTGMAVSFLAQGYAPEDAAVLACYLHGSSGDRLATEGMAIIPASQLITSIPVTIKTITTSITV